MSRTTKLAALFGRTRAAILDRAAVPVTTTQMARELGQSPERSASTSRY